MDYTLKYNIIQGVSFETKNLKTGTPVAQIITKKLKQNTTLVRQPVYYSKYIANFSGFYTFSINK